MSSSTHYNDVFSLQSEPFTVTDAVPPTLPSQSPAAWNRSQDITGWMDMTSKIRKGAGARKEKKPRAGSATFRVPGYGRPPPPPRRINAPSVHKKVSSPTLASSSPVNTVSSDTAAPALTFESSPIPASFSLLPSDEIAYPSFDTVDPCFLICSQPELFNEVLPRAVPSSYFFGSLDLR